MEEVNTKSEIARLKEAIYIIARSGVHDLGMSEYRKVCELLYPNSTKDWPK